MIVSLIGGSGTLGKQVVPLLLNNPVIERIRILSRGEHTQMRLAEIFKGKPVDFFIGDVRDAERVKRATERCDAVFHFAAIKSVDGAEYNPWEAVLTNVIGTKNVIEACYANRVSKAIFTSTDKAVEPLNLYGATKLVAEKMFVQANIGRHDTKFSVCRYGNVLASQGSVIEKWAKAIEENKRIQITDEAMTRFFISPKRAAEFVVNCFHEMRGGEVFIPKMKSVSMINLARAYIGPGFKLEDVDWLGIRPGEKLHEVLVGACETNVTTDCGNKYIRWPETRLFPTEQYGKCIEKGFTSQNAERFTEGELEELFDDASNS